MVDFNFSINSLFPLEVNIVRNDLIPAGYQGQAGHAAVRSQVGVTFICGYELPAEVYFAAQCFFPSAHFTFWVFIHH